MPWRHVEEPFARPPKVRAADPSSRWDGELSIDGEWAELTDVAISEHRDSWPAGLRELSLLRCRIEGAAFDTEAGAQPLLTVEARNCHFTTTDLSALSVQSLRESRIERSKLIGTDFSGATLKNVEFVECNLRYVNLRMAKLDQVRFVDCTLDEVDAFQPNLCDVEFAGSGLTAVNVDRMTAERVDLRGATSIELRAVASLKGCLVTEYQIPALAYSLISAVGLDVEQPDD